MRPCLRYGGRNPSPTGRASGQSGVGITVWGNLRFVFLPIQVLASLSCCGFPALVAWLHVFRAFSTHY